MSEESFQPYIHGVESYVRKGPRRDQFLSISMTHYVYYIDVGLSHACLVITPTEHGCMYPTVVLNYVVLS